MSRAASSIHRLVLLQAGDHFRRQRKARAIQRGQFRAAIGKRIHPLAIDELQCATRPGREADAED